MASTYLSRTPSSASNRKTWTWSGWVKRSNLTTGYDTLFSSYSDSNNLTRIVFWSSTSNQLTVSSKVAGNFPIDYRLTRVCRDTSAWYHIVVAMDTTQSTDTDRLKVYINGVLETAYEGAASSLPSQNEDTFINNNNVHYIGQTGGSSNYFNGYMNNVAFVDGAALTPTSFGETDSASGIWKFKSPSGITFGNNGYHLKMDNSANLGLDSSGETNNFTLSGNGRQAKDTPTNVRATMNPLDNYWQGATFSNGNNTVTTTNSSQSYNTSSLMVTKGKWYVECKIVSGGSEAEVGVANKMVAVTNGNNAQLSYNANGYAYRSNGQVWYNGSSVGGTWASYANGDIIGIAINLDNLQGSLNKLYFSKNGAFQNGADPSNFTSTTGVVGIVQPASTLIGAYAFGANENFNDNNKVFSWNFGNGLFGTTAISSAGSNGNGSLFEYDVPSGYYALNTKNINTYG